eukprot:1248519-Prymnesium_polylepis.1
MEGLSEYEISRAEQIKKNNAYLLSLGLLNDAKALRAKAAPKPKPKPKPASEQPAGPARRSRRVEGEAPEEPVGDDEVEQGWTAPVKAERDPFCSWVSAGTPLAWRPHPCDRWTVAEDNPEGTRRPPLTDAQLRALEEPLSAAERDALVVDGEGDEWVTDFLHYARAYGGKSPEPYCVPSRENFRKFLDTVAVLASGEGVTCAYRGGAFDAGVRYTPKHDVSEALGRALKWLPMAKDKSNGWTYKHPLEKLKQYQRALFWRHLF